MDTQPTVAPVQPVSSAPMQPEKNNKGLMLGLIGGAVALIAVVVAIVLLVPGLAGPSKDDYTAAYNKIGDARLAISELSSSSYGATSTYKTETELKNEADTMSKNIDKYQTAVNELGVAKAITADSEAKKMYDEFKTDSDKFIEASNTALEAYREIAPAFLKVNSATYSSDYNETLDNLRALTVKLDSLNVKYEVNKNFINEAKTTLKDYIDATDKYVTAYKAYQADYHNTYPSSRDMLNAATAFSDTTSDWSSNMQKLFNDLSGLGKKGSALENYLFDKSLK